MNGGNVTEKGPAFTVSDKYHTVLVTESISNSNGIMSTLGLAKPEITLVMWLQRHTEIRFSPFLLHPKKTSCWTWMCSNRTWVDSLCFCLTNVTRRWWVRPSLLQSTAVIILFFRTRDPLSSSPPHQHQPSLLSSSSSSSPQDYHSGSSLPCCFYVSISRPSCCPWEI